MQTSIIMMIILSCSLVDAKSMDIDSVISWYQPSDVSAAIKEPPSEQSSTTKASKTTTTSTTTSTQTPSRFEAIELLKQLKETHPDLFQEFSETKPEETPQNEYKEEIVPLARQMPMKMPMQAPSYYQQQQQHVQPPFFPFPSWPQFAASFPQMHPSPKRKNFNYANAMNQNQNFNNNEEDEETTNLNGYMGGASYPNRNYMPSFGQMPPLPPPMMAMMMKQMQRMMMNPFNFLADSGMNMPSPFYNSNNNYDQSQNQQLSQHEQVIPNALEIVRDLLDTVIRGKEESNSDGKDSFLRDSF